MKPPPNTAPTAVTTPPGWRRLAVLLGVGLALALLWSYWPTLGALENRWSHDPQNSHGYLVPAFALLVLWRRRKSLPTPCGPHWWGVALLAAAALLRLAGGYFYFDWLEGISLLASLAAVGVLVGGRRFGLWLCPAVVVLVFLFPPPYQVETALAAPLQQLATAVGTYALQTLGFAAVAEGNVILVGDLKIGVLEACSGLGMLSAFFAISTTIALAVRRPPWERVVVFLSAAPIGVLMNLIRITTTVYVYCTLGTAAAQTFFHDLAGWLMMPLAFAALWLELAVLARLFVSAPPLPRPAPLKGVEKGKGAAGPVPLTAPRPAPAAAPASRTAPPSALTV